MNPSAWSARAKLTLHLLLVDGGLGTQVGKMTVQGVPIRVLGRLNALEI